MFALIFAKKIIKIAKLVCLYETKTLSFWKANGSLMEKRLMWQFELNVL